MKHARVLRLAATIATAIGSIAACRAVAGIKDIQYQPPSQDDGGPQDDAEAGAPPDGPTPSDAGPEACTSSPLTLLNRPDTFVQLAVISNEVFVGTGTGILGLGTSGGPAPPTTVAVQPAQSPLSWGSFGLAPALAYYSLTGNPTGGPDGGLAAGAIHSVHLDGTNDNVFTPGNYPYLVTVGGGYVFWTDDPAAAFATGASSVYQCPLAMCTATPWISGLGRTYAMFTDSTNVYVLANDPTSPSMAANLLSCPLPTSMSSPPCGPSAHTVLTGVDATSGMPYAFASDGAFVYGTYAAVQGIVRVPLGGGSPATFVNNPETPSSLTVDADGHIYWTTTSGNVYRARTDGSGTPQLVACNQTAPNLIFTDTASVYFVELGGDSIVQKIAKPAGP